ncbi:MAG: sulfur carrier protein ThiS [Bacteroidales bacterium]
MKILLNNREEELNAVKLSVQQLLEIKKLSFRMRTVKINGRFISPAEYDKTLINDGDNIQVIYLMSGG